MWGGWGADWPSQLDRDPPLFDARINLTEKSNGQDYGNYESDAVNKLIDEAATKPDVQSAATVYTRSTTSSARTSPTSRWPCRSSTSCADRR